MINERSFTTVIIGEGTLPLQCAEILIRRGHAIRGVISPDAALRRWAEEKTIASLDVAEGCSKEDVVRFAKRQPFDYLFSIVNFAMVPAELLTLPRKLAINFHDGPLPRYAGLYATSWALLNQEDSHAVTWHVITDQVDAGDILKVTPLVINDRESAFSLNVRCYEAAVTSFEELVEEIERGTLQPRKQNQAERRVFHRYMRPRAAATISWSRSAKEIDALVRALDFGSYPNHLGLPKLRVNGAVFSPGACEPLASTSGAPAGTVTAITPDAIHVSTASTDLAIQNVRTLDGAPVSIADLVLRNRLVDGSVLSDIDDEWAARATGLNAAVTRHESFWVRRLADLRPVTLSYQRRTLDSSKAGGYGTQSLSAPTTLIRFFEREYAGSSRINLLVTACCAFLSRVAESSPFDVGFQSEDLKRDVAGLEEIFASYVPLRVEIWSGCAFRGAFEAISEQLDKCVSRKTYARDVTARYPSLRSLTDRPPLRTLIAVTDKSDQDQLQQDIELAFVIPKSADQCRLIYDRVVFDDNCIDSLIRQVTVFLSGIAADPTCTISALPVLTGEERRQLLIDWNNTGAPFDRDKCIHQFFEEQTAKTPNEIAVACGNHELTYSQLNRLANSIARRLIAEGCGPGDRVAVAVNRSAEMVAALLGILKAGAAYVPLDPTYPAERIAFMLGDSGAQVMVSEHDVVGALPKSDVKVVLVDDAETTATDLEDDIPCWERRRLACPPHNTGIQQARRLRSQQEVDYDRNPTAGVTAGDLAYVIYTSGSSGRPKGVMVTHRNVANLFAGIDETIWDGTPGVWLAVTSISFDISALELFWTLARGFKVIIHPGDRISEAPVRSLSVDLSLAYFASHRPESDEDPYRLLIEGAKFADRHGFRAVWTPERHFHAFGGLYPNPSVTSAAIAAITERVEIRAGSVVLPLHNPIRVAEEWSLVDNLSKGRVGISFASGWHSADFVFAPENYASRKDVMFDQLETVRKLWRGESVSFPGGEGKQIDVRILPRPVQNELPIWITAAGHPDTFRKAGELGVNVLTHLLGQSIDELAGKIALYREARLKHGHAPEGGQVTLMLHTFLGDDLATVREKVRGPFSDYLKSSVDLIKKASWNFPAFSKPVVEGGEIGPYDLSEEELDAIVSLAFDRYFETSGLFGTPETCIDMVARLHAVGVDEIACLIDFGVEFDSVMSSLEYLNSLKEMIEASRAAPPDNSVAALIRRHNVTHLQCTPSMATMLAAETDSLAALGSLQKLLLGGEAVPAPLIERLGSAVRGEIHNMYGPTETTIWSTTGLVEREGNRITIGRPMANTGVYILDRNLRLAPACVQGEIFIGGEGVARGYLNRPELTAERFIQNPFRSGGRIYRTGDVGRYLPDGRIEFLGRKDYQVKLRGFRVELGEIEAALLRHEGVREAAVIARGDGSGDRRLVGYFVPDPGATLENEGLRSFLKKMLPEYMVPSALVRLETLPLTPNGKLDRRALPEPAQVRASAVAQYVAPRNDLERKLAAIWGEVLNLDQVGAEQNFFDLGGHSLLMMRVNRKLRDELEVHLSIVDLFRYPTIRSLAAYLSQDRNVSGILQQTQDRAQSRRESMVLRNEMRKARRQQVGSVNTRDARL